MSEKIFRITEDESGVPIDAKCVGELVRCKDCKYWRSDEHVQWCDAWLCGTSALGYCHKSKRREEIEA